MPRAFAVVLTVMSITSGIGCSVAQGQWSVGVEVGADRFWGGSQETTAEHRSFRPYRPTTFGLGVARGSGRLRAGVRFQYSSASLALEGSDALVAAKGVFSVYAAAPELLYRIARLASNELLLQGGPLIEVWSMVDEFETTRVGVQAALTLRVPLGARLSAAFTAGAALIPSPFRADQLDPGFESQALWRRRVAGGLQYRL